jgi:hypothetical protein
LYYEEKPVKMLFGLLIGVIVGVLAAVFIFNGTLTARAQEDTGVEKNLIEELTGLLPDVGKIYRQCLGSPFRAVEKEIYDEDIANYYHKLMQDTGLDKIGLE